MSNESKLLDRNKARDQKFKLAMEELEKETTNTALVTQFPQWDLKPPVNLVKRRSTKLL